MNSKYPKMKIVEPNENVGKFCFFGSNQIWTPKYPISLDCLLKDKKNFPFLEVDVNYVGYRFEIV